MLKFFHFELHSWFGPSPNYCGTVTINFLKNENSNSRGNILHKLFEIRCIDLELWRLNGACLTIDLSENFLFPY